MVVLFTPSKRTIDAAIKLVPVTVISNCASPLVLLSGLILELVGTGLLTTKSVDGEVPPPGPEVTTVIGNVPAVVRSLSGIVAFSSDALTNDVVLSDPLKRAVEAPVTKLLPVTFIVKPRSLSILLDGLMDMAPGAGLFTVKVCELEVPPPGVGLNTVMA